MPTRIHNIGLEEVKRIRAEMEKTLEGINFLGTLDQFLVASSATIRASTTRRRKS